MPLRSTVAFSSAALKPVSVNELVVVLDERLGRSS
jgi:hypothetical protein